MSENPFAQFDQRMFRSFKSRLTRRRNLKDHHGVIRLWAEFRQYYDNSDQPWPDDWRRWERAAEDASYALDRMRGVDPNGTIGRWTR